MNEIVKHNELNEKQKNAGELIATRHIHGKTLPDIAEEVGVSRQTLYRWRQSKPFLEYVNAISDRILESNLTEANQRLQELLNSENDGVALKAIELIYKTHDKIGKNKQQPEQTQERKEISSDIKVLEDRLKELRKQEQ